MNSLRLLTLAVGGLLTSVLTVAAIRVVNPLLIFGGQDCRTAADGVKECVGILPAGLLVIALFSFTIAGSTEALITGDWPPWKGGDD